MTLDQQSDRRTGHDPAHLARRRRPTPPHARRCGCSTEYLPVPVGDGWWLMVPIWDPAQTPNPLRRWDLGDGHMILRLTLKTAALLGETPTEWQLLEKQVRVGRWTSGPRMDAARPPGPRGRTRRGGAGGRCGAVERRPRTSMGPLDSR
jgi:hypothetical protein